MANDLTNLFQSLVAANSAASQVLKFQNTFVDSIYWDVRPIAETPYTTLNVLVPTVAESDVVDIGNGPIQPTDTRHTGFPINFDKNFSTSFVIKEYDQGRTPAQLQTLYTQPRLESFLRKVNRTISAYFNLTNFASYPIVAGTRPWPSSSARSDIATAWKNLAQAGVPVDDTGNVFLTTSTAAYAGMLGDPNFITQSIVSDDAAISAQQRAVLKNTYGAEVRYDQHLQQYEAGKEPGALYHKIAMAGVTAPVKSMANEGKGSPVYESTVRIKNLDVRMQVWYSPDDQGVKVHYNCWWGVGLARTECCALLETA